MHKLILPAEVESQKCFGEAAGDFLFAEEEKIIAHATEARRREYAAVRRCARACLQRLGYPPVPILPGVGGAPTWPAGVQGSMTHCTGYARSRSRTPPADLRHRHRRRTRRTAPRRRAGRCRDTLGFRR